MWECWKSSTDILLSVVWMEASGPLSSIQPILFSFSLLHCKRSALRLRKLTSSITVIVYVLRDRSAFMTSCKNLIHSLCNCFVMNSPFNVIKMGVSIYQHHARSWSLSSFWWINGASTARHLFSPWRHSDAESQLRILYLQIFIISSLHLIFFCIPSSFMS